MENLRLLDHRFSFAKAIMTFLAIFLHSYLYASQPILLTSTNKNIKFNNVNAKILEDRSGRLEVEDILKSGFIGFKPFNNELDQNSDLRSTYWLMVSISNQSELQEWLWEFPDLHISKVSLYEIKDSTPRLINTLGFFEQFYQRHFYHKNLIFEIRPDTNTLYLAKIKAEIASSLIAEIKSHPTFTAYALREYYILGIYYGILFIMLIYNLFIFVSVREKSYLYYSIYVLACCFFSFKEDGIGFQYFWPEAPNFNYYYSELTPLLLLISFSLYSTTFLEVKRRAPYAHKLIMASTSLYLIYFITYSIFIDIRKAHSTLFLIPFVLIFITALHLYVKKRYKPLRFFVMAYSVLILSLIINFLRIYRLIPETIPMIYSFNFGIVLEVVIMSLALGEKLKMDKEIKARLQHDKIQTLQESNLLKNKLIDELEAKKNLKEQINAQLEQKVKERTVQLQQKTDELQKANDKLNYYSAQMEKMNSKLDLDNWELNKKIREKTVSSIKGEDIDYHEFLKVFPSEDACFRYLSDLKWKDTYKCRKCGNSKYNKGDKPFSRKCSKCNSRETVTANTLFHGLKFDINKAFYLTYLINSARKRYTLEEMSALLSMRTTTCWAFKKKVQQRKELLRKKGMKIGKWEDLVLDKNIEQYNENVKEL